MENLRRFYTHSTKLHFSVKRVYKKYGQYLSILGVLVIAATLRLYRISEYLTFLGDEGRDVLVVKRMLVDGKLTLLGPTSSAGGFFLGPLYYYMMAPFLWVWRLDPTGPAVMVALLSVATVYLLFRLVKKYAGFFAAISAALLYAVTPLVIIQSRSSWNPNVTPFFAVILSMLLLDGSGKIAKYRYYLIGLVLGLGVQTHYLFLFLFAVAGIWLILEKLLFRAAIGIREWLVVVVGVITGIGPLILFEIRHDFTNTRLMFEFLTKSDDTGFSLVPYFTTAIDVFYRIFGVLILRVPGEFDLEKLPPLVRIIWRSIVWVMAVMLIGFAVKLVKSNWPAIKKAKADFSAVNTVRFHLYLLLWIAVPVLLFGFYRKGIYDYYFGIVYAAPLALTGSFLAYLCSKTVLRKFIAIFSLILLVTFLFLGSPTFKEPNRLMYQVKNIARVAYEATGSEPFNFALITDGNSDHAYRYFFEIWGKPPVTIENKAVDPERKSVTRQLIVICETLDCQPLGNSLWEVAGFGRAEITGSWQVPFVTVYRLVHYEEKQ